MDKKIIKNDILMSLLFTSISIFVFNYTEVYQFIVIFIGFFIINSMWSWFINRMKPIRVNKDQDEILHPVMQVESTLHACNVQKHYGNKYNQKHLEKCDCGSNLFRIYNEDTEKGTYIQFICAKCNQKATGLEFNWKEKK